MPLNEKGRKIKKATEHEYDKPDGDPAKVFYYAPEKQNTYKIKGFKKIRKGK